MKEARDPRPSRALAEEREQLHKGSPTSNLGDFELPEWAADGALRFWFYIVPRHQADARCDTTPWKIVAQDHRFAYAVVVGKRAAGKHAGCSGAT